MTAFEKMLTQIKHDRVFIQTHKFPDPDAIACACGMKKLLAFKGIESTVCYSGRIDRQNTAPIFDMFDVKFINIDTDDSIKPDDEIILVDAQNGNSNTVKSVGNHIICIDHHPENSDSLKCASLYRFKDIRPYVGACASIIASYFYENDIEIDSDTASVLSYGIRSDTDGLLRGVNELDIAMYHFLFPKTDKDKLFRLHNSALGYNDLKVYANAINCIKVVNGIGYANVGHNISEALIAKVSDFMLQLKEVKFSVMYSFKNDGVKLSIRSEEQMWDAGVITSIALSGIGNGGGHPTMAGGFIPYADGVTPGEAQERALAIDIENRFNQVLNKIRNSHEQPD